MMFSDSIYHSARGVPYDVIIWANNLAGQGAVVSSTYFVEELGM